jgi:hypothetical protein
MAARGEERRGDGPGSGDGGGLAEQVSSMARTAKPYVKTRVRAGPVVRTGDVTPTVRKACGADGSSSARRPWRMVS